MSGKRGNRPGKEDRCPHCGKRIDIFKTGGGEAMAADVDVPFLGRITIGPEVVQASYRGKLYVQSHAEPETGAAFRDAITPILNIKRR